MKNNLVLSSYEKSLAHDCCNIFLEERTFFEVEKKPPSYVILDPILFYNKDRIESFNECEKIYHSILDDLYLKLNKIHNVQWTKKSWEILLGFWLRKFIYIVFFKFNNLETILKQKKIDKVYLSRTLTGLLASHESKAIEDLSINNDWSWILYSKIFEYFEIKNIEINILESEISNYYEEKTLFEKLNKNKKNLKKRIVQSYNNLTNRLLSEKRNFIAGTYLPVFQEKKLQILFGQIPTFYTPPYIKYHPIDLNLRHGIELKKKSLIKEKIIRDLLPSYIPTSILENFKMLKSAAEKHHFPKKPKFIFTSNIFESDEAFKFYVANIKSSNKYPKYFVGQHGNSYFTRIDNNYRNEMLTCDYFISWGQKGFENKKIINLFNLKMPQKKIQNNKNKILIIFRSLGYQAVPYDRWKEGKEEFLMIKTFLKFFSTDLSKYVHLRFHRSFQNRYKIFVQNYLSDILHFEKDFGEESYEKAIDDAKLCIFSYDSTGFLENLLSNKPSVCLYPNIYNHLNEDCKKYYKNLKDAKIIFDESEEMYNHINTIWPDVNLWWNTDKIQNAIINFSKIFSAPASKKSLSIIKEKIVEKLG